MIEINFKFQKQDIVIKSDVGQLLQDVCEEFAKTAKVDLDNIFFVYNGEKINLAMNYYVGQQFNLDSGEGQRIDLLVFKENPFSVVFKYFGVDYVIGAKETEKMKKIIEKFEAKSNVDLKNVFLTYSGNILTDFEEKTLDQIINKLDREAKVMTILVNDLERHSVDSVEDVNIDDPYPQNEENNNPFHNDLNDYQQMYPLINEVQINNQEDEEDCYIFYLLNNIRPIYIILIQIFIVVAFVGIGCPLGIYKKFHEDELFRNIILIIIFGICFIMCIILVIVYYYLKIEMRSHLWYIYHLYYIPLAIIIFYNLAPYIDYKLLLTALAIMFFALIPVIILKGGRIKLFVLFSFISSTIIIISSEFLWIKDGKKTFFLSFFAFFFDIYLGFVYHYSEGLFSYYDSIQSVIMFDYGLFAFMTFSIMMIFYPLYWISKKCIEFFSD